MAKKKKEDAPAPGSPAWMATFSDLMNLLLCFFVLLFAMSSVDEGKAEALLKSLANTFSIFDAGGNFFGDGNMISNGSSQLTELDEYFNTMGQTDDGDIDNNINDTENGSETAPQITPNPSKTPEELMYAQNKGESLQIYDEVTNLSEKYNLGDFVELGVDEAKFEYITIEIKGSLLFESGEAELMEDAKPIISRIGDILKQYIGYRVEVIGHTDTIPQVKAPYYNNDILSAWRARSVAEYLASTEGKNLGWDNVSFIGRGEHDPIASNETEEGRAKNRRVEIRLYNQKNR